MGQQSGQAITISTDLGRFASDETQKVSHPKVSIAAAKVRASVFGHIGCMGPQRPSTGIDCLVHVT